MNTGFCKSSSSSGTFDVGGPSLQLWIEDTHNKQCFLKQYFPIATMTDTLHSCTLFQKLCTPRQGKQHYCFFSTITHRRLAHLYMPPSTLAADSISLTAEAPYLAAGTNFLHGQEQFDYSVWWATLTSEDFTDAGDDRSVFEDLVRAHLTPLVDLSWSMSFKKTLICAIFCAAVTNLYTGGNHLIRVAQYFIKHVPLHRPTNLVDLALAVRCCKMIPCYIHIVIFLWSSSTMQCYNDFWTMSLDRLTRRMSFSFCLAAGPAASACRCKQNLTVYL